MKKKNNHIFKLPRDVRIFHSRDEYILPLCKGKKVLHIGCVDAGVTEEKLKKGIFLHKKIKDVCEYLEGIDINKEGVQLLTKMGFNNIFIGNAEKLGEIKELRGKNFDVIVAAEIIEHLNNPGLFLNSAKFLFAVNTNMIITTPNAQKVSDIYYRNYRMKGFEFIHPDHNFWFSFISLNNLLEKNGYKVIDYAVYSQHKLKLKIFPLVKFFRTKRLRRLYKANPFMADGLIFLVKPE